MPSEEQILSWIRQGLVRYADQLSGYRVVLFGSRSRRSHRARSDFDLGVIGERPLAEKTFHRIAEFLELLPTLHRIDWVDLNRVPEKLKAEALKNSEVLYG